MNHFRNNQLVIQKTCMKDALFGPGISSIGIHGIAGSFTDEALHRFVTEYLGMASTTYRVKELIEAQNVLHDVSKRKVDLGLFAFANSGSGGYVSSIESMGLYQYDVVAIFTMPIIMCLVVHPSIKRAASLKEFRGHPVAIAQCKHTLAKRWPKIPVHPDTDSMDTALSVQLLSEGTIAPTSGVFASERAAKLYGMKILSRGVHHDPNNATFFALVKPRDTKHRDVLARSGRKPYNEYKL